MACILWPQPEQNSQANRTWSNIVGDTTRQHFSAVLDSQTAEDYIPLETSVNTCDVLDKTGSKDGKPLKRKLQHIEKSQHINRHVSTSLFNMPWKNKNYVQDPTGLNEEVQDFLSYIKPRREEDAVRRDVTARFECVIKQLWPQAKVELYGSCQTGLYLPTSDIDLVVHGKWECLPLRTLENELLEKGIADANSIRVLDKATVPIIKVKDKKSKVKVDISFNMNTGVQSAEMIKSYMKQYPALPYLTFVLKQFLVNRELNEVFSGGISSYTVVLMIVSFFQHSRHFKNLDKDVNLGVLLIEFFELYGKKFNYNNVGIRLVGEGSYFNKEKVLGKSLANETHLCIEDPLTPGNYIGKGSFRINEVKNTFEWACSVLSHAVLNNIPGNESCSILGRITRIHQEAIEQRQRMLHLSSTNTPSYASVATRNTTAQTSAARSIIDTNTNSSKSGQNAVAKSCCNALDNQSYSTRVSNSKNTSTSRSDGDGDLGRDTKKTSIGRNSQNDVNWTTSNQQKPKRERQNCSDSTYSLPRETKERTHHSPHSLQRSPVPNGMTGPCGLRNNKTVKSIKGIRQLPERLHC